MLKEANTNDSSKRHVINFTYFAKLIHKTNLALDIKSAKQKRRDQLIIALVKCDTANLQCAHDINGKNAFLLIIYWVILYFSQMFDKLYWVYFHLGAYFGNTLEKK